MRKSAKIALLIIVALVGVLIMAFSNRGNIGDYIRGIRGNSGIGNKGKANSTKLVAFSYSYIGSVGGGSYTYKVEDNQFSYESMYDDKYAGLSVPVDEELLGKLKELYLEAEAYKWDGYSKSDMNVRDGHGFSVSFRFEDGGRCSADGSNCSPENFDSFRVGMQALLSPLAEDVFEQLRQKKIAEGFRGKVDNFTLNFIQQGSSGKDKYYFSVRTPRYADDINLDISIHSVSGEFFPEGDYRYYGILDSEYCDFSRLDALIEKYRLVEWYDYDVAAEDYNNEEWFQIGIYFDDDERLSAMGTEKPENYAALRREFLSYMVEFIDSIKDVYRTCN